MSAPVVKGWCPGALRPMMSGDGLVVRIRPPLGRLSAVQTAGIAALAARYGNGIIDLSNRANVQLHGVTQDHYESLINGLRALELIDPTEIVERRRNVIVTPFSTDVDDSFRLASQLTRALAQTDAPDVSAKFGYAIDAGVRPVLQSAPADIRLERGADGALILCAADHEMGKPVADETAVPDMLDLARWSLAKGARMARILADGVALPDGFTVPRLAAGPAPKPELHVAGALVATAFGQIDAVTLASLGAIRITPWRMVLIEGVSVMPAGRGVITNPDDPMLRITACVGAPACAQGLAETRDLARRLAVHVPKAQSLHVSGCAKGCAMPRPSDITLTATSAGYDLIYNGTADAVPTHGGLRAADIPDLLQKVP